MKNNEINIPKHWKWVTLEKVSVTSSGGTPDRKNTNYFRGNIPWVKSGELNYNVITETEEQITQEAVDYSSAKIFPKGSLLIALYGNTVGKMAFLGIDATTNQAVASIKSFCINSKYLYYYLMSSKEKLLKSREGSAQPNISQKILNSFPFPLAPIEEQNRIVEKIEELLSEIDNFKKNVIENKKKLIHHRQLIIFDIFKENSKYEQKGTWVKYSLSEIYNFIGGGTPSKKKSFYWGGDYNWASVKDINKMFLYETIDKITEEGVKNSSTNIAKKNELILVTRISPGKITIAGNNIAINQDLKIVKLKNVQINYLFTYYLFLYLENEILSLSKGTTVKGIQLAELNKIKVKIPDLKTQKDIIDIIENQITQNAILEKSINEEIERLDTLHQKIIQDAFKGLMSEKLQTDSTVENLLKDINGKNGQIDHLIPV